MKEFYIDFAKYTTIKSYTTIKAENKEQAIAKFWELVGELQDRDIIGTVVLYGVEEKNADL